MVRLAVDGDPYLEISDVELRRSGPSYTVDTIQHYQEKLAPGTRLFLIMGLDAVLEIDTWKSYRHLLASVPQIVISRPDSADRTAADGWKRLAHYLKTAVSAGHTFSKTDNAFVATGLAPLYILDVSSLEISSTRIRHLVKSGRSIRYLVPPAIADYIATKGLFK